MGAKHVTITPGDPPSVDQPDVSVSIKGNDHVVWTCKGKFRVTFDAETPFADREFNEHKPDSGPVRANAAHGEYKYTVEAGGKLDPKVIVGP